MTIIELLNSAEQQLTDVGIDTARLDAEVLLAHALKVERADLYLRRNERPSSGAEREFKMGIKRRVDREPVAYIRGFKEFYSIPIRVTRDVMIPRPETELLVERALSIIEGLDSPSVLDLCTGSGCISTAVATHHPSVRILATDISKEALAVASENLAPFGDRTELLQGNLFEPVGDRAFDLIAANPPYATSGEIAGLAPEIDYEPRAAIDGGDEGLDFAEIIINDAHRFLRPGAWLLMEKRIDHSDRLKDVARKCGCYWTIEIAKDLAGIERVIAVQRGT